ncbi:MAG: DUF2851 family protein [Rikenellaceae bacterium]
MLRKFRVQLLDLIWRYKPQNIAVLKGYNSTAINILDFGVESMDGALTNYDGVKIEDDGITKVGSVKFFESHKEFDHWTKTHPLSCKALSLAICCDRNTNINNSYYEPSVAQFPIPVEMMMCYSSISITNIRCANIIAESSEIKREILMTRLFVERLEQKEKLLQQTYLKLSENMNEVMLHTLFDTLFIGTKNREPMNELFTTIKGSSVLNHLSTQYHYEALLLGAAGLIDSSTNADEYLWKLRKTFREISERFAIKPMHSDHWAYSSYSPRHTVWIMLVYFASLLHTNRDMLIKITDIKENNDIIQLFKVGINEYWRDHNYIAKTSNKKSDTSTFPKSRRNAMVINGIVPFLFFYHKTTGVSEDIAEILINLLINTEAENHIHTRTWSGYDVPNQNAFQSQALTQLSKCYCNNKQCTSCPIGISMLLDCVK